MSKLKQLESRIDYAKTINGIPEGWVLEPIENLPIDIIDGDRGKNYPKQSEFENNGFCLFLNTKNVPGDQFDFTECNFVSEERDRLLRKGKLQKGDIVLTTRGTVGNTAYFHEHVPYEHIRINSGMVIVRNSEGKFDTDYLYQLLKSPLVKQQYFSFTTGSAQPQLPIRDINKIKLTVPPTSEQRAIAKILSDLDAKINLNRRMNETLEQIVRAIFKRWFVDFEFPGHEKTKIVDGVPEGWTEVSLTDVVDVLGGGTPSTTEFVYWGTELPFFTPKDASDNCYVIETEKEITLKGLENCNSQKYPRNTVFITARGTVGKVCMAGCEMAMNQSCYAIRGKSGSGQQYYTYHLIKGLADQLIQNAHGTVFETITTETFRKIRIIYPSQGVLGLFANCVEPFYDLMLSNIKETKRLAQIRDTLLPKLMSGKIRVK